MSVRPDQYQGVPAFTQAGPLSRQVGEFSLQLPRGDVAWEEDTVELWYPDERKVSIPVSVWLTHADFVHPIIAALRPRVLAEVGVYTGASLLTMRAFISYYRIDCQLFGIDPWRGDNSGTTGWVWNGEKVFRKLSERTKRYRNVHLLRLDSEAGATCFPDGSIDLLHIDADHREAGVRRDVELWLPKLAPNGVVLMHDVGMLTDDCQVWKVWREIQAKYPTCTDTRACGLGAFCPNGVDSRLRGMIVQAITV